jgi:hypothetical protein
MSFVDPTFPTYICHLHKSLYGLKQASRAWYTRLSDFFLFIGFRVSKIDTFLFILLSSEFKLHDLSNAYYFLGIEVTTTSMGLMLSQHKYVFDIFCCAGMSSYQSF